MSELKPCPFCGGEAEHYEDGYMQHYVVCTRRGCYARSFGFESEAEAITAWNTRAAMEFDNWFYLPKPKEPIVEVTETTHAWDGTKVRTDVFYQVQKQSVINWARELDEHIIKRICEVWNTPAVGTCHDTDANPWHFTCSACGYEQNGYELWNYCPNCGAKVVGE